MKIIPMRDLKNTVMIEALCEEESSPVFVTKNGYGKLVVMDLECFERITKEDYKRDMYMLRDVYEKIENECGFLPGNVYLYNKEIEKKNTYFESPERFDSEPIGSALYDKNTGNFHLVPREYDSYLSQIVKARDAIYNELIKNHDFDKIIKGRGNKNALQLEKYVGVEKDGYIYLLCFERLYTHKTNVHCMLGLFQFYSYPKKDKNINIVKGEPKGRKTYFTDICYPNSFRDGKKRIKESLNGEHIVLNPKNVPSVFDIDDDNISKVCGAFIDFINQKENSQA